MKKIVITGAGLAGLTTAYYLLKNSDDFDVTILDPEVQEKFAFQNAEKLIESTSAD